MITPYEHRTACGEDCEHVRECETCKAMLFPPCNQHLYAIGEARRFEWSSVENATKYQWAVAE